MPHADLNRIQRSITAGLIVFAAAWLVTVLYQLATVVRADIVASRLMP